MSMYDDNERRRVQAELEMARATVRNLNERLRRIERIHREQAELRILEAQRDAQAWRPETA